MSMSVGEFVRKLIPTDLFGGMGVTGGYLFRRKETVQYPEKRLEPPQRFRGLFGYDEERCIDCHLCAKACPIDAIDMVPARRRATPGTRGTDNHVYVKKIGEEDP